MINQNTRPLVSQPSVLFICTANRVRSPMAVAFLRNLLIQQKLNWRGWRIESAGTWATDGQPMMAEAIYALELRGLHPEKHRSRRITEDLICQFNLILAMEVGHKEALQTEFPDCANRIFLLSEMAGRTDEVMDPTGGSALVIETIANTLEKALKDGLPTILQLARKG